MEEYAYVLDYLPQGRPEEKGYHHTPVVEAIGEDEFKLLELVPKQNAVFAVGDKIYIGMNLEMRTKIVSVRRRISYQELSSAAVNELPFVLESIVKEREPFFVDFFNKSQPINTRIHSMELLPGLGNKTMWNILDERKKAPFQSFKDLTDRVKTIHHPEKMIVARIIEEMGDRSGKYKMFTTK